MNFRLRSFHPAILVSILSTTRTNALEPNPELSPQILSDTTDVCLAQGRTSSCEVLLDVPAACIPSSASSSDCPIVFFFHGAGGSNAGFARNSGVHSENVIGVYPQGEDGWNTGPKSSNTCPWTDYDCTSDPDEGAFIASIISNLRLLGATGNVYLIGNSNGAALSHRLASNADPDHLPIKAIVTKVTQLLASPPRSGPGVFNYNQPGTGTQAVSILNLMGLDDGLIPYGGGGSAVFGGDTDFQLASALESMATWAAHNGCGSGVPVVTSGIVYSHSSDANAGDVTFYDYQGCPDGIIVEHYALGGAGHSFRAGAELDGVAIDHAVAYEFIHRVEASGGGGGGGTASPVASPVETSAPTLAPVQSTVCEDDPNWHGKFNVDHTCSHIAANPTQRCGWESTDGTEADDACKVACDSCPTNTASPLTPAPVTSSPTKSPVTFSPTPGPAHNAECENDHNWHGKFNGDHTCDYVAANPDQRCVWESVDGTKASDACKLACDTCDTPGTPMTASPTTKPTGVPTGKPNANPTEPPVSSSPTKSPVTYSPVLEPVDFTAEWMASYAGASESLISPDISSIMNYQPSMPIPDDALDLPTACPHLEAGLVDWNDTDIVWPLSGSAPPPADGSDITLPADSSIIIRAGQLASTSQSPYGRITVPSGSRLIFDDNRTGGSTIEIHTLGITVEGALEVGSPTCRIEGNIEITLHGEYGNSGSISDRHLSEAAATDMGLKGIFVKDLPDARIDIHGKLYHPTWTRLAAPVPGNTQAAMPAAPVIRNSEIFLQDCVNWPDSGKIFVTTSHVKDTRGYNFNEEATIAAGGVMCVTVDGKQYGKVILTSPLEYYHHAGEKEYQCEVGLLTRNILIHGNDRSDPTDISPLECDSTVSGWTKVPCPDTFLTGFGGHTIVLGQAEGRFRGVEFHRMGMTNVLGRYPVHFHHQAVEAGQVSEVTDCAVHRSYFRAITVHDAFHLKVQRNTAFDISGHAYYLESGVEEHNRVEYNLAAFVHVINGAVIMPSNTVGDKLQTDTIVVPADHSASGFYISNVHNYVVGNAASGGWAGMQFPVLPEPVDKMLRFNGVVPKDRPSLLISGNSVHSSSWFAQNSGAMYEGGSLYWDSSDVDSETLIYNAGRVSSSRLTRYTKDENGEDDWFRIYNTTVWLANIGATGWGKRAEINGLEVSDFQNRAVFVLFTVWLNKIVINCRTSNAPLVPDPGTGYNENVLNNGKKFSGFFTYDHLMNHILTNWRVSNCGGVARGLEPWVEGGDADTGTSGLVTIPVNGLAPEVQLISKGMQFDWPTVGGEEFVKESIFFAASGNDGQHSMQYQSNWEDSDGSWTNRKVGTGTSTVMGPARAGEWWHLDYRPGKCEVRDGWKFPHQLCDKDDRSLASMFTVVMPQIGQQGSAVLAMIDPNANARQTRQGSMTHFGLLGDSSLTTCSPPEPCSETTSRSWDPDLTGPFNHAQYGGWYLAFDEGTPVHLSIMKIQLEEGATMVQAMSLPPGTTANDVHIWAESSSRQYDFTLAGSVDDVRNAVNGDNYFLDETTNTLYWRIITGYVGSDSTYGWIDREAQGLFDFSREGLTIIDTTGKNQIQIHIEIACPADSISGAFCKSKPEFNVPSMGCPAGTVMVAIDQCGQPCELLEEGCGGIATSSPSSYPNNSVTTPLPSSSPTYSCVPCTNDPTPWMSSMNYECATAPKWLIRQNCNIDLMWVNHLYCEQRCQNFGLGYDTGCC